MQTERSAVSPMGENEGKMKRQAVYFAATLKETETVDEVPSARSLARELGFAARGAISIAAEGR